MRRKKPSKIDDQRLLTIGDIATMLALSVPTVEGCGD